MEKMEGGIFDAGEVGGITAETVQAIYGLPVEIHYYKGNPLVLPLERDRKEDESCPAPSAKS
jgi:hypothetical protein